MRFRRNLRFRVALSFALLGAGVSLGMVVGLDFAANRLERRLLEETMSTEMQETQEDFSHEDLAPEPSRPLSTTVSIRSYVLPGSDPALVPGILRGLTPGYSEVRIGSRDYAVSVADSNERRFFVLFDKTALSRYEDRAHLFLAVGIALMGLLSAVGGRWLAPRRRR